MHLIFAFIASGLLFVTASGQTCTPLPKKADLKQIALNSEVAIVGKIGKKVGVIGKGSKKRYNITVTVDTTFKLNNGGLKKKKKITVGPFGKAENCIDIKKGKALFFLKSSGVKSFYWISTNPKVKVSKKDKKMVSKFLTPPKFKKIEKDVTVRRGYDIKEKCRASGKPDQVYWTLNGAKLKKPFPKGVKVKGAKKPKLEISRAEVTNSGKYVCVAHNSKLNISAHFTLNVNIQEIKNCNRCSDESFCLEGICCQDNINRMRCLCYSGYSAERCNLRTVTKINKPAVAGSQTAAILGLCLAMLVSLMICVVAYVGCRKKKAGARNQNGYTRKSSIPTNEEEIDAPTSAPLLMSNLPIARNSLLHNENDDAFENRPNTNQIVYQGQGSDLSSTRAVLDEPHNPQRLSDRRSTSSLSDSTKKRQRLNGLAKSGPFPNGSQRGSSSEVSPTKLEIPHQERLGQALNDLQNESTGSRSSLQHHHAPRLPLDNGLDIIVKHQSANMLSGSVTNLNLPNDVRQDQYSPSTIGSAKNHKVTTFEPDGKIQQENMGRDEGPLSSVTTHSPVSSSGPTPRLGHSDDVGSPVQPQSSLPGDHRHFQFNSAPKDYYMEDEGHYRQPLYSNSLESNRTENDDPFSGVEIPNMSLGLDSDEKQSPAQVRRPVQEDDGFIFTEPSPKPVYTNTASAQLHQLPLLSKQAATRQYPGIGSTVSLSSGTDMSEPESPSINV
uniref:Pro-neuregulin-2, membrane-bound isoform-like n=1 Tax=Phallusia mammillata TaxID=59560 RepID=A0A6F9DLY8_9ASCI|nr:pro-neuregulin-2, membrane-bound isoform-like [Phallusia mammillata]